MKTYNIPILTSKEDFDKIVEILEMERFVFNECSKFIFKSGKNDIRVVHASTYHAIRNLRPEIPSQIIIRGTRSARSAYKSVKSNKHEIESPCVKKNLSIRLDKRIYKWIGVKLRLTTKDKRIDVSLQTYKKVEEMFGKYETSDPLIFLRNGKLYLAVTFKTECPNVVDDSNCVGVDMGVKNLLASSDGRIYNSKSFLRVKRNIRFLKRKLQSKGTKSARRHLKKIRRKESNFTKNFAHQLANAFLSETKSKTIVFEDLKNLKSSSSKKNKNKRKLSKFINDKVAQVPISLFREIISQKAKSKGISIILVNPAFTSQIDCRTGKKSGVRQKGRYLASDGKVLHSDLNAAVNVAERAKIPHFLTNEEILQVIVGQGAVNHPIVCKSRRETPSSDKPRCFSAV